MGGPRFSLPSCIFDRLSLKAEISHYTKYPILFTLYCEVNDKPHAN